MAMIDTFSWYPRSRTVSSRMVSTVSDEQFQRQQVQVRGEKWSLQRLTSLFNANLSGKLAY